MLDGYKVICVTPAGRKQYLEILQRYIRREFGGLVDGWHLWQNTNNPENVAYIKSLGQQDARITVFESDSVYPFNSGRICNFFRYAVSSDTIYVRFDDDVVWVEPGAIEKLVRFRIANKDAFLVSGNLINNPVCAFRQARVGAFKPLGAIYDSYIDEWLFRYGIWLHERFFEQPDRTRFYFPDETFELGKRFGIQFISWFGSDCGNFAYIVPVDEEEWLTVDATKKFNRPCAICGSALAVHYAYTEQRLGTTGIPIIPDSFLSRYRELASGL